ncbi:MAG: hypothetical protein HQL30_09495 [Candidatus Omnitrophica bacterium]|nr:hypothetical protein [Candidatus Omnitrophota bacterium]
MVKKPKIHCDDNKCAGTDSKNLWLVGTAVIMLVTLFCFAIAKPGSNAVPVPDAAGSVIVQPVTGGVQAAFTPDTHPTADQMLSQWQNGKVAWANPNCIVGNQGSGQGVQWRSQAAVSQARGVSRCPVCNFPYNSASGVTRCANCGGTLPLNNRPAAGAAGSGGGFTNVALPANCMVCPNVTQCFPPGQAVALTQTTPAQAQTTLGQAPPIFRDAIMPHAFRGVCENCHIVRPDIAIQSTAQMPHGYRGVCSNCHLIIGLKAGA